MEHMTSVPPSFSLPAPVSTLIAATIGFVSLVRVILPWLTDEIFALVPHHTIFSPVAAFPLPFVWNLLTCHLFEVNLLKAAVSAPATLLLVQMLERLWSPRQLFFHLIFSTVCAGAIVLVLQVWQVHSTQKEKDFFAPLRGCCGQLVAWAVGLRHSYPLEALPLLPKSLGMQCQHVPFAITSASTVLGLIGLMPEWQFAPLCLFFSWLHLRYFMWFPHASAHGDHSPDFCFSSLFPEVLRPFVAGLGVVVHGLTSLVVPNFVKLRVQEETADSGTSIIGGHLATSSSAPDPSLLSWPLVPEPGGPVIPGGPGSKEYNARRAKALKILDENINSLVAQGTVTAGSPGVAERRKSDGASRSPPAEPQATEDGSQLLSLSEELELGAVGSPGDEDKAQ